MGGGNGERAPWGLHCEKKRLMPRPDPKKVLDARAVRAAARSRRRARRASQAPHACTPRQTRRSRRFWTTRATAQSPAASRPASFPRVLWSIAIACRFRAPRPTENGPSARDDARNNEVSTQNTSLEVYTHHREGKGLFLRRCAKLREWDGARVARLGHPSRKNDQAHFAKSMFRLN